MSVKGKTLYCRVDHEDKGKPGGSEGVQEMGLGNHQSAVGTMSASISNKHLSFFCWFFLFKKFFVVLCEDALWHLQKSLQYIKYIILEFTPSTILLYLLLPPFLEQFQQVSFLIYIHVYTVFAPYSPS
jgi:hypothetical protein